MREEPIYEEGEDPDDPIMPRVDPVAWAECETLRDALEVLGWRLCY